MTSVNTKIGETMGYYTYHTLDIKNYSAEEFDKNQIIEALLENEEMEYALGHDLSGGESCKWYDHDKDMCEFSALYPGVLFIMYGEGEESGDIWVCYFLNGKYQYEKAQITYNEFNPNKLEKYEPPPWGL
jgi:hypothetical protein